MTNEEQNSNEPQTGNSIKADVISRSYKEILRMLVEWHEASGNDYEMDKWFKKYPSLSCMDIVRLSRKKLNG